MRSLLVASVALTFFLASTSVEAKKPKFNQLEGYTFEQYQKDFSKAYEESELPMRKKIFTQRLAAIQKHNADKSRSYNQGVNHMSDWTDAERKALMGNKPHMKASLKESSNMKTREVKSGPLPQTVDYRTSYPPVLTAVKDQGRCGSCWAHAATESIESHWAIEYNELYVLSQQQITSCTPNPKQCGGTGGCDGAIAELGWDYVVSAGGIQEEWTYPYESYFGDSHFASCQNKSTNPKAKKVAKLTGYTKAKSNDATAMAEALANAGPLAVSVDASHWFEYEGGIYNGCSYNISMDHAVQLVGYGHDYTLGQNYWIVRNSWSPGWGEQGFIRLHRPTDTPCGWNVHNQDGGGCKGGPDSVWACGMCGIAWDAVYPNVVQP